MFKNTLNVFVFNAFLLLIFVQSVLNQVPTCVNQTELLAVHNAHSKSSAVCYSSKQLVTSQLLLHNQTGKYPSDQLPNSGPYYDDWAAFGLYSYIPPEVFVHNLMLGAAVFLYHPCASLEEVEKFKTLANRCTWRHVISPFSNVLNETYRFGIVTYGCEYLASNINVTEVQDFMKHRLKAPGFSLDPGKYDDGLLIRSLPPSNPIHTDNDFCANISDTIVESIDTPTTVSSLLKSSRSKETAWAAGSLLFLLSFLTCAVCYTRLWRKGKSFERSRAWNDETDPGSVSMAAIVRRFPHLIKDKVKNVRHNRSSSRGALYQQIINEEESYSEDEV